MAKTIIELMDERALADACSLGAWYGTPPVECKGATAEQKAISAEERAFYTRMTEDYSTQFRFQRAILDSLLGPLQPIIAAGPSQRGFTAQEETAYRTQAREGTAREYSKAREAVGEALDARGGGLAYLPSGGDAQIRAQIAKAAAASESDKQLSITTANYGIGRDNYFKAAGLLSGAAGLVNPAAFSGAATNAGNAAANTANQIQQADAAASPWNAVAGIIGGGLSAALGNPAIFGGAPKPSTCWIAAAVYDGWSDPRTILVRWYLTTIWETQSRLGAVVMAIYRVVGRPVAAVVRRSRLLRACFHPLFNLALRKAKRCL